MPEVEKVSTGSLLGFERGPEVIEENPAINLNKNGVLTYAKKKAETSQSKSTPVLSPPSVSSGRPCNLALPIFDLSRSRNRSQQNVLGEQRRLQTNMQIDRAGRLWAEFVCRVSGQAFFPPRCSQMFLRR